MAMARVALAIHLFFLCSYQSGHPLKFSFWREEKIHLQIYTNRLLREEGKNDNVEQMESPSISGTEGKKEIQMISHLQLQSGKHDQVSFLSANDSNLKGANEEASAESGENGKKSDEENVKKSDEENAKKSDEENKDANSNTKDAESAEGEENPVSQENQMKTLNNEEDKTNDGKKNGDEEDQKGEKGKDDGKGEEGSEEKMEESAKKEEENTEANKNLESKHAEAEVSEHKQDVTTPEGGKDSPEGENQKENTPNNTNQENQENADNDENKLHLDKLDDDVPHYSALRNNRVDKGITDSMMLKNIIEDNTKSCSVNNGGCADDQICIRINNMGIKCICKEGHLFGGKCILSRSSAINTFFSVGLSVLLAFLWMC
uniref:Merozoite surface protein 5 n=1 Tax=Plasmodium knowlesi TaxID=5850 RepID=Q5V9M0_PLAKN|nr:merozoite surface protein 5 [Plasmodium knowlesi]